MRANVVWATMAAALLAGAARGAETARALEEKERTGNAALAGLDARARRARGGRSTRPLDRRG